MNRYLILLFAFLFTVIVLAASNAHAKESGNPTPYPYHDLVIGPTLSENEPLFQDGTFMLGNQLIGMEQGALPKNKLVDYDPAKHKIIVSDDKSVSDVDKSAALLQLMDALSIQSIEPAAGP